MMTNLFSIFDPTLSIVNLMPITFLYCLLFLPFFYWVSSLISSLFSKLSSFFSSEISYSLGAISKGVVKTMGSVFLMLCFFNFFALFPFVFSLTSHMSVTFPLSFSLWFMVVVFFWFNFIYNFLSHLIPVGTPLGLMSFMVLVELISNFIRPIALTFRLTANMMAGHLLMSLIGGALVGLSFLPMVLGSMFQMLLVFMELGVSIIQAYVFFTLLVLYMSEINPH
uniref:ATP synthase subunit a n=1 Tax=Histiostomatidae sp. XFX TaxID=2652661 RepID=A0A5J6VC24_9ACAR|nr:ATP synthase subunit 6 [Histiostomatidae sp. XFX]